MGDARTNPSFERYVAGLPGGLHAHASAQAKGSLVRCFLDEQPRELLGGLPAPLQPLVRDPPMDSDWIPEAHFCALLHALAEVQPRRGPALLAWVRARNRTLFSSPLYRVLMAVTAPEAMLRHVSKRWGAFHRGTTATFDGYSDDGARVTLAFPVGLFDPFVQQAFAEAFGAALEAAQAPAPVVLVEAAGPGFARYVARW